MSNNKLWIVLFSFSTNAVAATNVAGPITSDTTWDISGSPYNLTGQVQVGNSATLTINPGVTVNGGASQELDAVDGVIEAIGTKANPVSFNNIHLNNSSHNASNPGLLHIEHSTLTGGSIRRAISNNGYGSLVLRNSKIINPDQYMYLWYPTSDVYIEGCSFLGARDIIVLLSNVSAYIRNNLFVSNNDGFSISGQAAYGNANLIVEYNTFDSGASLWLPSGYTSAKMNAVNNYWGTINEAVISSRIHDKHLDLTAPDYITYKPFLLAPDPNTPSLPVNLKVNTVGSGKITSDPQGIDCGITCSYDFGGGDSVTLNAVPLEGYYFSGWSGACSGTESCTVTLNSNQSVTATFNKLPPYSLNVSTSSGGIVTSTPSGISCSLNCASQFLSGVSVSLTALPSDNFKFMGWSGACSGDSECTLLMDGPKSVIAEFKAIPKIAIYPQKLDFGTITSGYSGTLPLTIKNIGAAPLAIESLSTSILPFSQKSDKCSGKVLKPGKTCQVIYQVTPKSDGSTNAFLEVLTNDPNTPVSSIELAVIGGSESHPLITHLISPMTLGTNGQFSISGSGFGIKKGKVMVGKKLGKIISWTDSSIIVTEPGLSSGIYPITVVKNRTSSFTVESEIEINAPSIEPISQNSIGRGSTVRLEGHFFGNSRPKVTLESAINQKTKKSLSVTASYTDNIVDALIPNAMPDSLLNNLLVCMQTKAGKSCIPIILQN